MMTIDVTVLYNNGKTIYSKCYYYNVDEYKALLHDITNGDSKLISISKYNDDTIKKNSRLLIRREEVISIDLDCST